MSKVLVTGATGFIGGHLVDSLVAQGHEVTALTRASSRTERLDALPVRLVRCDLGDRQQLAKAIDDVDTVYHVAGMIAALSKHDRQQTNVEGTRAVAQACAERTSPPTLLLMSSIAAAGPTTNGRPIRESDPSHPVSHYGRSKREAELVAATFADRLPLTVVRPPLVFGERDRSTQSMFQPIRKLHTQFIPGWRHRRRYSFIHVQDLVGAVTLAAERGRRVVREDAENDSFRQGCYFAADEACLTYGQFGRLIADSLGFRRLVKLGVPDTCMKFLGALCDARSKISRTPHILSSDKAREITAGSWTCSSQLAQDELGFRPGMSLPDRLKQTALWFQRENWP